MRLKSIIVDDESKSRSNLRHLLQEYCPTIEVAGEAASAHEALKIIKQVVPDLLFLDIEMPSGTGFDLLKSLNGNQNFEVIFVTAFDKYGIEAVKACALDYLLKPLNIFELVAAVEKAQTRLSPLKENIQLKELVANMDRREEEKRIALPLADKIAFVPVNKIIRLEADGNYTHFLLEGTKQLLVCKTLKEFDELLSGQYFLRTHQSHLVNLRKIASYVKTEGGYILLEDGSQVPVSRQKREEVMKRITGGSI